MTVIGDQLLEYRKTSGKSLRDIAQGHFSPQTLNNYERGLTLPSYDNLPHLAQCYGIDKGEIERLYYASLPRAIEGALAVEPFLDTLKSIDRGDHIVIVTQRALIADHPELSDAVLDIIEKGANFTYVSYIPESVNVSGIFTGFAKSIWQNTQFEAATFLGMAYRKRYLASSATNRGSINYLLVGKPDTCDFAFLRAFGASVYLCRHNESDTRTSEVWGESHAPDDKNWWQPYDQRFMRSLHHWLVQSLGLNLPDCTFSVDRVPQARKRQVRFLSLEEFASKQL